MPFFGFIIRLKSPILFHFSAKRIHKSKRRRRRTGDNAEEPIESDGALEDTSGEEDDEEGNFLIWRKKILNIVYWFIF